MIGISVNLEIQQNLWPYGLKSHAYPKITEVTFTFPKLWHQAINQFIQLFIPEIHLILESHNQIDDTHFLPFPPKKLSIENFFFFELVSTCQKSGYFIHLFWRFRSFVNTAI